MPEGQETPKPDVQIRVLTPGKHREMQEGLLDKNNIDGTLAVVVYSYNEDS